MKVLWVILLDSYRMMHARKLFWICFSMSLLAGIGYASIEFHETGYSVGFGLMDFENSFIKKDSPMAQWFYVMIFNEFFVRFWLGGGAVLLAIVATSSIYPELTKEGAIEVTLSKPVGRWQIFFSKFFGGCLFTFLQSFLFVVIVFAAVGLRVGVWNYTLFWAVPLVTFVFSMLFCISVLIGVLFRSEIFAIIGTLMFWGLSMSVQTLESFTYDLKVAMPKAGMGVDWKSGEVVDDEEVEPDEENKFLKISRWISYPFPKTASGVNLLNRFIVFPDSRTGMESIDFPSLLRGEAEDPSYKTLEYESNNRHSTSYIVWSSLGFEAVILGIAGFVFVRRDY